MESLCTSTNTKRKQNRKSKKNSFQLNPPNTIMSEKTKDFLQKICYKRAASVDMTKFGFVQDRRIYQVNMLLKPLREQLEKICGIPIEEKKKKRKRVKKALPATQTLPVKRTKPKKCSEQIKKTSFNPKKERSKCVNFTIVEKHSQ